MTRYLLQEGAQQINDAQSLYLKCDLLQMGMSDCEIISILPSYLEQPRIMTFPLPHQGYEKRDGDSLFIDFSEVPRVTILHLDTPIERPGPEFGEAGTGILITPSMLENGCIYGITPGTTLAKELGWEQ